MILTLASAICLNHGLEVRITCPGSSGLLEKLGLCIVVLRSGPVIGYIYPHHIPYGDCDWLKLYTTAEFLYSWGRKVDHNWHCSFVPRRYWRFSEFDVYDFVKLSYLQITALWFSKCQRASVHLTSNPSSTCSYLAERGLQNVSSDL